MLDEFGLGHRRTRTHTDKCFDRLAAVSIWYADNCRLEYCLVFVQYVFDFARPDLITGGIDLLLFTVGDVKPTVFVHVPDVTGVHSPIVCALRAVFGGGVGCVPVSSHDLGHFRGRYAGFAGTRAPG